MSQLRNYFLGPFRVTHDGKSVIGFESYKVRALLAYLVIGTDHPQRREALAALLWPEQSDIAARQSLRHALYILRQALAGDPESGIGDRGSENEDSLPIPDPRSLIPTLFVTRQTVQF